MPQQVECQLYLDRAKQALLQARDNFNLEYYDVTTSRAYYAMFYAASALPSTVGVSRSKHSGVHSAFGQHFVRPGLIESEYSRMLVNAFNVRLDSDYEVQPSLDRALAEDILRDAKRFVKRRSAYLGQEGYL